MLDYHPCVKQRVVVEIHYARWVRRRSRFTLRLLRSFSFLLPRHISTNIVCIRRTNPWLDNKLHCAQPMLLCRVKHPGDLVRIALAQHDDRDVVDPYQRGDQAFEQMSEELDPAVRTVVQWERQFPR